METTKEYFQTYKEYAAPKIKEFKDKAWLCEMADVNWQRAREGKKVLVEMMDWIYDELRWTEVMYTNARRKDHALGKKRLKERRVYLDKMLDVLEAVNLDDTNLSAFDVLCKPEFKVENE